MNFIKSLLWKDYDRIERKEKETKRREKERIERKEKETKRREKERIEKERLKKERLKKKRIKITCTIILVLLVTLIIQVYARLITFSCPKDPGDPLPYMPKAYSTDVRFNFPTQLYTIEAKHSVDTVNGREALELWTPKRHVKYIISNKQALLIKYQDKNAPTCTVLSTENIELDDKDAGPNGILQKIGEATQSPSKFVQSISVMENGIFVRTWEACLKDPSSINISMGFTEINWGQPRTSPLFKDPKYLVYMEAQIWDDHVVAVFDNFNPTMPDDVEFQPPENVYCDGFRRDKKPPTIKDYFSYDAEIIVFESTEGIAPMVSHRKVFYDYHSKIARIDFYDPLTENEDTFSKISAQVVSIIHDFNSSVQYNIDPASGKCYLEDYIITVDVVEVKETKDSEMLTGQEFFSLDTRKISYNGQFVTRGHWADVYTAMVPHLDGSGGKSLYTWYFSTGSQIVENDKVEKNVLLRMVIQPEAAIGYQGRTDVNFYNFRKEEPNALVFDISGCYNESVSKKFVLTFPANENLKGSEKFLKLPIHLALTDVTGLSKQRIFVSEVSFNNMYMFAEFKILDAPAVIKPKATTNEMSLSEAISKIKRAISDQTLEVSVTSDKGVVLLKPEPDGFNEFSGDRRQLSQSSYKEGSVIALTVGMLFLGFVLGGIALNLIISRKYGVSLFQNSNSGMNRFDNESSL